MSDEPEPEVSNRVEENDDGTIVIRLHMPVKRGKEQHSRITVHEFTTKSLPKLERSEKEGLTMGVILDVARDLCAPPGISDQLRGQKDTQLVVQAVTTQMGKYQAG